MDGSIVEDSSPGTIIKEKLAAPTGDLTEAELLRLRCSRILTNHDFMLAFPRIDSTNANDVVALDRPETLVELLLAAREEFREVQQRCESLAAALHQAKQSLETLEAQSLEVQNAQARELALLFSESESKTAELEHKSTRLELHNKRLLDEMAVLAMSQRENEQLKQTVLSLRDKMARDQEEHARDFEEVRESVVEKKQRLIRDYHDLLRDQGLQNSTHSVEDSRGEFVANSNIRGALSRADVAAKREKKVMQMRDMVSRCEMFQTRYARLKQEAAIHEQIELERTRKLVRQGAELDRQKAETAKAFEDAESYRKENQLLKQELKQAMSCLEDNAQLKTLLADRDRHAAGLRDITRQRVRPRSCKLPVTTSANSKQGIVVEGSDMPLFGKDNGEGIVDLDAETTAIWKATKDPFSDTCASHPLWAGESGPSKIYCGLGSNGRGPRQRRVGSSLSMREREAISPTLHFGDRGKQRSKTSMHTHVK